VTLTEERFGSVPRWYIECTHDNAVRIARQRAMVKKMPCKVITMECGHTPFYSQPEELAEHLETIARS
jgi:pimeloyl-ACP methyl ester carboxylesterase